METATSRFLFWGVLSLVLVLVVHPVMSKNGNGAEVKQDPWFPFQNPRSYPLTASIMCRFFKKDEALESPVRLAEWIEFYRILGVQHFYVFDDARLDGEEFGSHPLIQYYIKEEIVTYWRVQTAKSTLSYSGLQRKIFVEFFRSHKPYLQWHVHTDIDEYFLLEKHDNLIDFLTEQSPGAFTERIPKFSQFLFDCWFYTGHLLNASHPELPMIQQYVWRIDKAVPSRSKSLFFVPQLKSYHVHEQHVSGPSIRVPYHLGIMNHYWKNREPRTYDINYSATLANKFGPRLQQAMLTTLRRAFNSAPYPFIDLMGVTLPGPEQSPSTPHGQGRASNKKSEEQTEDPSSDHDESPVASTIESSIESIHGHNLDLKKQLSYLPRHYQESQEKDSKKEPHKK